MCVNEVDAMPQKISLTFSFVKLKCKRGIENIPFIASKSSIKLGCVQAALWRGGLNELLGLFTAIAVYRMAAEPPQTDRSKQM